MAARFPDARLAMNTVNTILATDLGQFNNVLREQKNHPQELACHAREFGPYGETLNVITSVVTPPK